MIRREEPVTNEAADGNGAKKEFFQRTWEKLPAFRHSLDICIFIQHKAILVPVVFLEVP